MSLFLASCAGFAAAQESDAAEALATNANPQQAPIEAAEQGDVPVKSRAQSALKYLGPPTPLIVASPFPRSIPVNLATSLSSATRLWTLKQNFQNPAREYSITGRSPLIRGGVNMRLANQSIQQTPLKESAALANEAALEQDAAEAIARLEAIDNYNAVIAELEGEGGVWNSDPGSCSWMIFQVLLDLESSLLSQLSWVEPKSEPPALYWSRVKTWTGP